MRGASRRKGRPISGWLILDKPQGMGSTECVARIKRLYAAAKAGHAGTLDPLASGMLPIALGEATRTVPYVMDGAKFYSFTIRWGVETETDDAEGKPVASAEKRPSQEEIVAALASFQGQIEQIPPTYSAVKIDGERAYSLARGGEEVELGPRLVTIHELKLESMPDRDHACFVCRCGKGVYVRAIARDLGRQLGCFGHISQLRRTGVGNFAGDDMVCLDELEALAGDLAALDRYLLPTASALVSLHKAPLTDQQAGRVRAGTAVLLRGPEAIAASSDAYAVTGHELVAVGHIEGGYFHPRRIFRQSRM